MNENTLHRINKIRDKILSFHSALTVEIEKNQLLQKEVSDLKSKLNNLESEKMQLESSIAIMKDKATAAENKEIKSHHQSTIISDGKIDELINEIEYCINQLKNN
ncbi:MAG: hypothetical protein P8I93_04760 [Crocinitomicaceae bacterium]|nr:hypothetical protein [Crocinitomicaceae bacterium]